ncbi:apyrase-like [Salvia miltiorrhiza]|uniref:apyrase-like n=1 Tax=Salvia miltiorrhiza TaxID=226208 RepID=UPI0025AD213C|nr:apyrase-like [Salvia miltiorrhiza]
MKKMFIERFLVLFSLVASEQQKYAVVFDAGSTGSRVHVFSFDSDIGLLKIDQDYEFYAAVTPGLSSYPDDPKAAADSLRPLLDQAQAVVPQELRSTTPLKLGATAGLRLLPGNASEAILEAVKEYFEQESSLDYRPEWVSVLEGTDEAAYMWLAINYLLESLRGGFSQTVGVVDLGGGSVQMAYALSESAASNAPPAYVFQKLILGTNYNLYTHSYLNYGLKAARAQSLNISGGAGNPCVTNGYQGTYEYNGEVYNAAPPRSGTNLRRCRALARKVLKVDAPCSHNNCTFDGIWSGGGGDGFTNLYIASYFYDTAAESGIVKVDANTARIQPIVYRDAAKRACRANIENIKSIFPAIEEGDLGYLCMDLVYEYSLLVDGFHLDPFEEVTVVKNVDYKGSLIGAAWPLGCAVELLSS